jgi:outer membrane immunogenic protein
MRKSLVMGFSLVALLAGPAFAADLPGRTPYAPVAVAPAFSWTGCYFGGHVGGGAMHDSWTDEHGNGAVAGGQIGCNYQTGMLVFGIEGDGFWSGMKTEDSFSDGTFSASSTTKNKWDFSIAGRFGVAIDRTLIYAKAGWVWGKFDFSDTLNDIGGGTGSSIGSATLDGVLLGTGVEYALTHNWTVKAEYNYLNFGTKGVTITRTTTGGVCCAETVIDSQSADKHIIKLGANYKF